MPPLLLNSFWRFIQSVLPQMKQIVLTSGSSWTVPSDWNSTNNAIHCIGGGGGGTWGGGGGGAYARISNLPLTPGASVPYQIGAGGLTSSPVPSGTPTWFKSTTTVLADGGQSQLNGSNNILLTSPGGQASSSVGEVVYSGGQGAAASQYQGGGGGGGAAGPHGSGLPGHDANNGTYTDGNGGTGDNGYGGAGGIWNSTGSANAQSGANGTEWTTAGAGGGGGGLGYNANSPVTAGAGGLYGAGGGGGTGNGGQPANGAPGVIVIQYWTNSYPSFIKKFTTNTFTSSTNPAISLSNVTQGNTLVVIALLYQSKGNELLSAFSDSAQVWNQEVIKIPTSHVSGNWSSGLQVWVLPNANAGTHNISIFNGQYVYGQMFMLEVESCLGLDYPLVSASYENDSITSVGLSASGTVQAGSGAIAFLAQGDGYNTVYTLSDPPLNGWISEGDSGSGYALSDQRSMNYGDPLNAIWTTSGNRGYANWFTGFLMSFLAGSIQTATPKLAGTFIGKNSSGNDPTVTLAVPSGVAKNDLMLAFVMSNVPSSGITNGHDYMLTPVGWNYLGSVDYTLNSGIAAIYWRKASASEPASYTWEWTYTSASQADMSGVIITANDAYPIDATPSFQLASSGSTLNVGSVQPRNFANNADLQIAALLDSSGTGIPSVPSGFTSLVAASESTTQIANSIQIATKALTDSLATASGISTTTDSLANGSGMGASIIATTNPLYKRVASFANTVNTGTTVSSSAVDCPEGSLIVVGVMYNYGVAAPTFSDTAGNAYIPLAAYVDPNSYMNSILAYCLSSVPASGNVITATFTSGQTPPAGIAGAVYTKQSGSWAFIGSHAITGNYQTNAALTFSTPGSGAPCVVSGVGGESYSGTGINLFSSPLTTQTINQTYSPIAAIDFFEANGNGKTYNMQVYDWFVGQGYGGRAGVNFGVFQ